MQLFFTEKEKLKDNRWDSNYWRPDLLIPINQINNLKYSLYKLGDISSVVIGQAGKRTFIDNPDTRYIVIGDLLYSGINFSRKPKWVIQNSFNDPIRSRLQENDILIAISGGGSIGKTSLVYKLDTITNISQDIACVRLFEDFPKFSTFMFLQSKWGISQILRFENGTGVTHLNQSEVKQILVPKFSQDIEEWCENQITSIKEKHEIFLKTQLDSDYIVLEKTRQDIINKFYKKVCSLNKIKI